MWKGWFGGTEGCIQGHVGLSPWEQPWKTNSLESERERERECLVAGMGVKGGDTGVYMPLYGENERGSFFLGKLHRPPLVLLTNTNSPLKFHRLH